MKKITFLLFLFAAATALAVQPAAIPLGTPVTWDRHSLLFDGKRVCAVMGEVHYSRIPAAEWAQEVRKMKEGGITIIACYVFWNHIEEIDNQFDWSGQRDLRAFLNICREQEMPVVLRMGPFCHGEARNGGIPDFVVKSGCKLRSEDPQFLAFTERFYRQIFTQVQGLQWKDGGPVIAAQFDNEYGGHGSYLMALKRIALGIGFDLPFYTRTGWPELASPVPFGEMIPLYGDYADGFWDRSIKEGAGNYYKAFNFHAFRGSTAIASEQLNHAQKSVTVGSPDGAPSYPYFTCELGGGMMQSYHRRIYTYPQDAYAMAVVKLGSGSNLLGYYMYHGGTNPDSKISGMYLNETQRCLVTNYNDLPVLTYDFQAPLGEFGQVNPHYFLLRKLHLFMRDFGEELAPMDATFPCQQDIPQGDDTFLRWSYRSNSQFTSNQSQLPQPAFVFINNYERLRPLSAKKEVQFEVCGVRFPKKAMTVPAGMSCILPVNLNIGDGNVIRYATAQPISRRDGALWFQQLEGIPAEFCINGKVLKVKKTDSQKPFTTIGGTALYLISDNEAGHLFLPAAIGGFSADTLSPLTFTKIREAGPRRTITIGEKKVAEEPVDEDFENAAVYRITLPDNHEDLLRIHYRGDVARLYAISGEDLQPRLIDDNFYNGNPFLYGLWRLPSDCRELELRILPLQADMPVYFPREADKRPGEEVVKVERLRY